MIETLAVLALGLSAGAMLAEGAVLVPYWRSLAPSAFLAWYAANASRLLAFFAPLELAATVLAVVAAILAAWQGRPGTALLALSAALAIAVLVSFPLYFRDVNASFATGSIDPEAVPGELARWAAWHWGRTLLGAMAFVAAVLAVRAQGTVA